MPFNRRTFLAASAAFFAPGDRSKKPTSPFPEGNYAPVREEISADDLKVIGKLPPEMDGLFVRTGPNPRFPPKGNYHWFDGDGMLHGVRVRGGKASYRNRYVRTEGWLLTYVYDAASGRSEMLVIDAGDFAAAPVLLPARVPFGFHGTWLPGAALG